MARQWKKKATVAYGYALTRFALNNYMYYEELPEAYEEDNAALCRQKPIDEAYQKLLHDFVYGGLESEAIMKLRTGIRKELEDVVAFIDGFRNYEYALNRVERRFDETLPMSGMTDAEAAREIVGFVGSAKEAADMNRRIQEMIGQLPVRFTRQKYFGMVQDALTAYIGADSEALENIMYLLHTAAMTGLTEEKRAVYPELKAYLETLEGLSFRDMTREAYQNAVQMVTLASDMLNALSEYYQMMQEMVNDLYLLNITQSDAVRDVAEETHALKLLKLLLNMEGREIPEETEEQLCGLEGVQEEYFEKYLRMEPAPEYQEGEDEDAARMRLVDLLMSSSSFMELNGNKEQKTVSREDVEHAFALFVQKAEPVFKSCQKPVMRAVMAATLSLLPICFNSIAEVQNYVENSLGGCSDAAEKEASIELIHQLMEMEDYAGI